MWRFFLSFAFVIAFGVLVISNQNRTAPSVPPEVKSTQRELSSKQTLLEQDVRITDDLCRNQCRLDLHHMLTQIQQGKSPQIVLQSMSTGHEKMHQLVYSKHEEPLEKGVSSGELPSTVSAQAKAYMKEAKTTVVGGKTYQSPAFGMGAQTYFVLGVPASDGKSSLIGLIHQDILQKVADHQRKNLRLEAYPSEHQWKVESVDTNTLKDKVVDHPEDNQGTSHYHENEVVVRFRQEPTAAQIAQIKSEIGARTVRKLGYTYVFQAGNMEAKQLMSYFKKWNVAYAEPHFLYLTNDSAAQTGQTNSSASATAAPSVSANFVPNDFLFSKYQWNLPLIETVQGWQVNRGAENVIVAVVDTGVDLQHQDLRTQLVPGYNVVSDNNVPSDDVGHGTHVAGVISALVNNNLGVAGMTWYNKVMPVKVLDQTGAGSTYAVAQGIIWATDHGAKVINMSLGNYADSGFLHDAIKYAYDKDVVLVAASGNDNTEQPGYPAAYSEVFAVAATDSQKKKATFSNYGDYVDVAAPGVSIASTYPNNQYAALSGTSMASPHVTALAALIRSTNPTLKNTEVYEIMRQTAQDLGTPGKDKYYGHGLIDVVKAVETAAKAKYSLTLWPQFTAKELSQVQEKYAQR
jgi:thermitase